MIFDSPAGNSVLTYHYTSNNPTCITLVTVDNYTVSQQQQKIYVNPSQRQPLIYREKYSSNPLPSSLSEMNVTLSANDAPWLGNIAYNF